MDFMGWAGMSEARKSGQAAAGERSGPPGGYFTAQKESFTMPTTTHSHSHCARKLLPILGLAWAGTLPGGAGELSDPALNASLAPLLPLEQGWDTPPRLARTRVWWWWLNGYTDKETITRELEAMKAAGIGGANVIDAGGDNQDGNRRLPHGPDFATPAWRGLFRHAMAEAARLDLEMGFNIQSGWNLGGPTVTADETTKRISWSAVAAEGGRALDLVLPQPVARDNFYRDVAVVAVPRAGVAAAAFELAASSNQPAQPPARAGDGDPASFWVSRGSAPGEGPLPGRPEWLELRLAAPAAADRLVVVPRDGYGPLRGKVQALDGDRVVELAEFNNRGKSSGPLEIPFPETTSARFRLVVTASADPNHPDRPRNVQVAELGLRLGARTVAGGAAAGRPIKHFEQKAYYTYPGAFTATTAWHLLDCEPQTPDERFPAPGETIDLTARTGPDGRLRWDAPAGAWDILRIGYTVSGAHVSTHSEGWGGYAIDYLDRSAFESYWSKVLEPIFAEVRPYLGKSLRFLHTDSWELGPVNWTARMPEQFRRLRGYDITPWLPVLTGRVVGDRESSTRFLNDFRRTLADLIAENKYAAFAEKARAVGAGIHPESGGPHAGPMDALRNLGLSDVPMGEFWSTSPRHRVHDYQRFFVKQTTSAANTYGRRVSLAEAFTNIGRHWQHSPQTLKPPSTGPPARAQPDDVAHVPVVAGRRRPARARPISPASTCTRTSPGGRRRRRSSLHEPLPFHAAARPAGARRAAFLRRERAVLRAAQARRPGGCLPGYDYDVIDREALLERVRVDGEGRLVLPEGTRYRLLSLVPFDAVGLEVLRHVAGLVEAGATLAGPAPRRPFSLSGGAAAEAEFAALRERLWDAGAAGEKRVGKGRVIWGRSAREVLQGDAVPEDFTWTGGTAETMLDFYHKRTADASFYYVANRNPRPEQVELAFRVAGLVPEIWDPVSGRRRDATRFRVAGGQTFVPLALAPSQSFFAVFRRPLAAGESGRNGPPNAPVLNPLAEVAGPWQVAFNPQAGGPGVVVFDKLSDWTTHADEGIRHYSGAAVYRREFARPAGLPQGRPLWLDLGKVGSICEVAVNGRDLGVVWTDPFRVEIPADLLKPANALEIKVVNLWANRVIGDAKLPPEKRRTRTNITRLTAASELSPSGLLGPVRLLAADALVP
jgi:hypothetical protein